MRKVSDKGQTGVVMLVKNKHAVVMMPGGEFRRLAHGGEPLEIGQSVWVPDPVQSRAFAMGLAPVAAAALVLVWLSPWHSQPALAAVVSVDINPSINLNVNATGRVLSAQGMDAAGRELLSGENIRCKTIAAAVELLVGRAAHDGYFRNQSAPTVLLGAVFVEKPLGWFPAVSRQTAAVLKTDHVKAQVVAVSGVSAPLVKEMQKPHVSVGRYLVWKASQRQKHSAWSIAKANRLPVNQLVKPVLGSQKPSPSTQPSANSGQSPVDHRHVVHHEHVTHDSHHPNPHEGGWPNLPVTRPSITVEWPEQNPGETGDGHGHGHAHAHPSISVSIPGIPSGFPGQGDGYHGHSRPVASSSEPTVSISIPERSFPGGQDQQRQGHDHHGHHGYGQEPPPSSSQPIPSISIPAPSLPGGQDQQGSHHQHHGHHGYGGQPTPSSSEPIPSTSIPGPSFPGGQDQKGQHHDHHGHHGHHGYGQEPPPSSSEPIPSISIPGPSIPGGQDQQGHGHDHHGHHSHHGRHHSH